MGTTAQLGFRVMAKSRGAKSVEILIYDVIGEGLFGGLSAKELREQLKAAGDVEIINVRINSPGGYTADGFAMLNALREHPARVVVDIDGAASSMASVIAQAGDVRRMADNAEMMIHEARSIGGGSMTAAEHRSRADALDRTNQRIANVYAEATHQSLEQIREWMAAETPMTATEAKERGFVDEVTKAGAKEAALAWEGDPPRPRGKPSMQPSQLSLNVSINGRDPQEFANDLREALAENNAPAKGKESKTMSHAIFALALGLAEGATEDQVVAGIKAATTARKEAEAQRDQLVAASKAQNVDEAVGTIAALIAERFAAEARKRDEVIGRIKAAGKCTDELEKDVFPGMSIAALEAFERSASGDKRAEVIARIKAAGKCTPAQEKQLFPNLDVAQLEAFEQSTPKGALPKSGATPPAAADTATWNNKSWSDLSYLEKHDLKQQDPDLYWAMRKAAGLEGRSQAGAR